MNYKGIVLAGGLGTRLSPLTKFINKHLLPIYDKPLIFYSLSILMLSKIRDILIICRAEDLSAFKKLLGDGSRFGINLHYKIQESAAGIPEAFIIGEKFIKNSKVALILGDNFFHGHQLTEKFLEAKLKNKNSTIFLYPVKNPTAYGIIDFSKNNKIKSIKEKPKSTTSNLAITGFYLFDENVSYYAKKIKKSKRNELEIVSLIKHYYKLKKLKIVNIGRGSAWLDAGTFENLNNASFFVENIERRQGLKIACLEEIGLFNKWIDKKEINISIGLYGNCSYSNYLKTLI